MNSDNCRWNSSGVGVLEIGVFIFYLAAVGTPRCGVQSAQRADPTSCRIHLATIIQFCNNTIVSHSFPPDNSERFRAALRRFDEKNSRDPNTEVVDGAPHPREAVHARWLTDWVLKLCPGASETLRLAARCQHLCRWMIPRDSYPKTRAGYLKWREGLKKFHAQRAGEILREAGYPENLIQQVQNLNLKKNFPDDPESQVLEDALCLVFLEHEFAALAGKTSDEKMVGILQKTWKKMSPAGRAEALKLSCGSVEKALLERALK